MKPSELKEGQWCAVQHIRVNDAQAYAVSSVDRMTPEVLAGLVSTTGMLVQQVEAYFGAVEFIRSLNLPVQSSERKSWMFYFACFHLPEAMSSCMGALYSLVSNDRLTGLTEGFVYFPAPVSVSAVVESLVSNGGVGFQCVPLPEGEHPREAGQALSKVVRASEEATAGYKAHGECPVKLREIAQVILETVDLTKDPDPVRVAVKAEPSSVPEPWQNSLRVAMSMLSKWDNAYKDLQYKHTQMVLEMKSLETFVKSLEAQNAQQVSMLAENNAWIAEQATTLAHYVAHIQMLTEEFEAQPGQRAAKRRAHV